MIILWVLAVLSIVNSQNNEPTEDPNDLGHLCLAHTDCTDTEYCTVGGECEPLTYCCLWNDGIDGSCRTDFFHCNCESEFDCPDGMYCADDNLCWADAYCCFWGNPYNGDYEDCPSEINCECDNWSCDWSICYDDMIANGVLDNGVCDPELNCARFDYDNGICNTCTHRSCDGQACMDDYIEFGWHEDAVCDTDFLCAEYNWDNGACGQSCDGEGDHGYQCGVIDDDTDDSDSPALVSCGEGRCCSIHGYCGNDDDHCNDDSLTDFSDGKCPLDDLTTAAPALTCTAHADCMAEGDGLYCDIYNSCWEEEECCYYNDPIDGSCPITCGGSENCEHTSCANPLLCVDEVLETHLGSDGTCDQMFNCEDYGFDWGDCIGQQTVTVCEPDAVAGTHCDFPFIYGGVEYTACTAVDDADHRLWCITDTNEWGYCMIDGVCGGIGGGSDASTANPDENIDTIDQALSKVTSASTNPEQSPLVVDGDSNTDWIAKEESSVLVWLKIDLMTEASTGETTDGTVDIAEVAVDFHELYNRTYSIFLSDDNVQWELVAQKDLLINTAESHKVQKLFFTKRIARYIKIESYGQMAIWGVNVYSEKVSTSPDQPPNRPSEDIMLNNAAMVGCSDNTGNCKYVTDGNLNTMWESSSTVDEAAWVEFSWTTTQTIGFVDIYLTSLEVGSITIYGEENGKLVVWYTADIIDWGEAAAEYIPLNDKQSTRLRIVSPGFMIINEIKVWEGNMALGKSVYYHGVIDEKASAILTDGFHDVCWTSENEIEPIIYLDLGSYMEVGNIEIGICGNQDVNDLLYTVTVEESMDMVYAHEQSCSNSATQDNQDFEVLKCDLWGQFVKIKFAGNGEVALTEIRVWQAMLTNTDDDNHESLSGDVAPLGTAMCTHPSTNCDTVNDEDISTYWQSQPGSADPSSVQIKLPAITYLSAIDVAYYADKADTSFSISIWKTDDPAEFSTFLISKDVAKGQKAHEAFALANQPVQILKITTLGNTALNIYNVGAIKALNQALSATISCNVNSDTCSNVHDGSYNTKWIGSMVSDAYPTIELTLPFEMEINRIYLDVYNSNGAVLLEVWLEELKLWDRIGTRTPDQFIVGHERIDFSFDPIVASKWRVLSHQSFTVNELEVYQLLDASNSIIIDEITSEGSSSKIPGWLIGLLVIMFLFGAAGAVVLYKRFVDRKHWAEVNAMKAMDDRVRRAKKDRGDDEMASNLMSSYLDLSRPRLNEDGLLTDDNIVTDGTSNKIEFRTIQDEYNAPEPGP